MKFPSYIAHYHAPVARFLHSFFIKLPIELWFRFLFPLFPNKGRFVNLTSIPTSVFEEEWKKAQKDIGEKYFTLSAYGSDMHVPDPRALGVEPSNVTVVAVEDEPVSNLVKISPLWNKHKDPSGCFLVESGLRYSTVVGMACTWKKPRIYIVASSTSGILQWEFANVILNKLGYKTDQR